MQRRTVAYFCGIFTLTAVCCATGRADPPEDRGGSVPALRPLELPPGWSEIPANAVPSKQTSSRRAYSRKEVPVQQLTETVAGPFRLATQQGVSLQPHSGETIRQVSGETDLLPLESAPAIDDVHLQGNQGLVTLIATGAELSDVLRMIADHHRLNLVLGPDIRGPVTVSIRGARLEEVLDAILGVAGFSWHRVGNLLYVTGATASGMDPRVQGRSLQVYPLDYVSAEEVEPVVNGLLSPVGTAYTSVANSADQLRTRELIVVEDTVSGHRRVAEFIAQIDIPPRQVLVEAHVLQIALGEDERHGIDWRGIARHDGARITLEGTGFTDSAESTELTLTVDGRDMDSVIELIRQGTNSRTLASPKLSVVNHQEAKIQIGQRLPYTVATTTQTTTVQSVEFLEVGIVLTVRPVITDDGNILMTVLPKVSGGKITAAGFPEEDTTEVQTTIMMPDGGGVIIGGLIREDDVHNRSTVPWIGQIPVFGHLFRKRTDETRRNELVVALVTHVMHDGYGPREHEMLELEQTLPMHSATALEHPVLPMSYQGVSE